MPAVKIRIRPCALQRDLAAVVQHSQEMRAAMRRLRRDLEQCQGCPSRPNCPFMQQFNQQVAQAIQEINDEFQLAEFFQ
jgi:hypothetical protein